MAKVVIDDVSGEVIEKVEDDTNYQLAKRELNELAIFDEWLERKEALLTAEERFKAVDRPFRGIMTNLFKKHSITRLTNDYIDIVKKNGYCRKTWDDEKLKAFIILHGGDPNDFMNEKWISGSLQMKYLDER